MTVLRVLYEEGRLDEAGRGRLADALTATVLQVEVGVDNALARGGVMVLFEDVAPGRWAVGGRFDDTYVAAGGRVLIQAQAMAGVWTAERRRVLIEGFYAAVQDVLGLDGERGALGTCWVVFDEIAEGSWGAFGGAFSIRDVATALDVNQDRRADIERTLAAAGDRS